MNNAESLQSLLDQAVAKRKTSIRQLGFAAQDAGYKVVGTTLGHIRAGRYKSVPSAETIRAIAWLAGVDDSVAFAAAGQPVPGPPLADELPPGADNLSPKSRKAVVEMVRVLVDLETINNDTQAIQETGREQARGNFEQAKQERRAVRASWTADDPDGSKQKTLDLIRKASEAREEADPENFSVVELHGDEARAVPVPPRDKLAAHPKVKTKREQLEDQDSTVEGSQEDE